MMLIVYIIEIWPGVANAICNTAAFPILNIWNKIMLTV